MSALLSAAGLRAAVAAERARITTDAAVALGRIGLALELAHAAAWLTLERAAASRGEGTIDVDPRELEQAQLILDAARLLASRVGALDDLREEIAEQRAAPQEQAPADEYDVKTPDRRDEPVPDDWAV